MIKTIIAGVVWPAVATGIVLAIGAFLRCRSRRTNLEPAEKRPSLDGAVSAASISFGYCVGHVAVLGWPSFPPVSAEHWLVPVALAAGLLAVLETAFPLPSPARWVARCAALGLFLMVPLAPMWRYFAETSEWSQATTVGWMAGFSVAFLAGWVLIEGSARRSAAWAVTVPMGVAIAGVAVVSGISGSASLGQLAGSLAVSLGTLTLACGGRPVGGGIGVCWFMMIAVLFNGFTFGEVASLPTILLILAPFSSLVGVITAETGRRRWVAGLAATVVSATMTGIAVLLSYREFSSLEELPY